MCVCHVMENHITISFQILLLGSKQLDGIIKEETKTEKEKEIVSGR